MWISDIQGALTVGVLVDYSLLWDLIYNFELHPEVDDTHIWGQYSASPPMRVLHNSVYGRGSGRLGRRPSAGFFFPFGWWRMTGVGRLIVWLGVDYLTWTMPSMWPGGWKHKSSPSFLCVCMAVLVLSSYPLPPQPLVSSFDEWWATAEASTSGLVRQGLNSLIIFGAWTLWSHWNRCLKMQPPILLVLWSLPGRSAICGQWRGPEGYPSWWPPPWRLD